MDFSDIWSIKKNSRENETAIELSGLPPELEAGGWRTEKDGTRIYDNEDVFHHECVEFLKELRDKKESATFYKIKYRDGAPGPYNMPLRVYDGSEPIVVPNLSWTGEREVKVDDYADADYDGERYVSSFPKCGYCSESINNESGLTEAEKLRLMLKDT